MAYFDNINPTIFELVPDKAQRILELGCGAGALAAALREKCMQLENYIGVEIDPDQAQLAAQHTTKTLTRDLDQLVDWNLDVEFALHVPPRYFDCVIMGDVLEHLRTPLATMQQAASRLRPGGSVIACIPNVQHWTVFVNLVRGTWPTEDAGLFDRTHLRWFTVDDMVRLFQDAGMEVSQVVPRVFESEQGLSVMEDLEPLARNLGTDPDVLIARGQALQFVLVGKNSD